MYDNSPDLMRLTNRQMFWCSVCNYFLNLAGYRNIADYADHAKHLSRELWYSYNKSTRECHAMLVALEAKNKELYKTIKALRVERSNLADALHDLKKQEATNG